MKSIILALLLFTNFSLCAEGGKIVNPLTDICWECVFPMTVAGVNVTPGYKDFKNHNDIICHCKKPPKPGIPLTFWEPNKLVDVTKEAYKLVGLGGISLGSASIKNRGNLSKTGAGSKTSFAHVHIYDYPVFEILGLLTDFACIENNGAIDLCFFSELDYTWYDDSLANLMNAEVGLFSNPLAQVACVADCLSSSISKPLDKLFWCAGCHGSLYPFSGTVGAHVGDIQASLLLMQRGVAKMHREGFIGGYKEGDYCSTSYMPIWKKSAYKSQIVYPVPQTTGDCPSLGGTEVIWGAGKSYPYKGEEFVYVLWTKKQCCLDISKAGAAWGNP